MLAVLRRKRAGLATLGVLVHRLGKLEESLGSIGQALRLESLSLVLLAGGLRNPALRCGGLPNGRVLEVVVQDRGKTARPAHLHLLHPHPALLEVLGDLLLGHLALLKVEPVVDATPLDLVGLRGALVHQALDRGLPGARGGLLGG